MVDALIIGEKINSSRKGLKEAVDNKDEEFIRSLPWRTILNRAYLVICAFNSLDTVILDPEDRGMLEMVYASETLVDRDPYCSGYLNAYRKGILG